MPGAFFSQFCWTDISKAGVQELTRSRWGSDETFQLPWETFWYFQVDKSMIEKHYRDNNSPCLECSRSLHMEMVECMDFSSAHEVSVVITLTHHRSSQVISPISSSCDYSQTSERQMSSPPPPLVWTTITGGYNFFLSLMSHYCGQRAQLMFAPLAHDSKLQNPKWQ